MNGSIRITITVGIRRLGDHLKMLLFDCGQRPIVHFFGMITNREIQKMPLNEKLRVMEVIWDDLCRSSNRFESPEWHREVLHETKKRVESGQEEMMDWGEAKERLRQDNNES